MPEYAVYLIIQSFIHKNQKKQENRGFWKGASKYQRISLNQVWI